MILRQILLVTSLTLASSTAMAQTAPPTQDAPHEPRTSEDQSEKEKAETRNLYQRGKEAYDEEDYESALELFTEVYERTNHPALLFNIAQAHRLAGPGHCLKAHDYYVEYLVRDSMAPNGDEVRERIKELEPCAKAAEESQSAPQVSETEAPPEETKPRPAPAITLASGIVLIAGLGLFTAAKVRFAEAKKDCPCEPGSLSQWKTMEQISIATMVVGGAGVAAGGLWWSASVTPKRGQEQVFLGVKGSF